MLSLLYNFIKLISWKVSRWKLLGTIVVFFLTKHSFLSRNRKLIGRFIMLFLPLDFCFTPYKQEANSVHCKGVVQLRRGKWRMKVSWVLWAHLLMIILSVWRCCLSLDGLCENHDDFSVKCVNAVHYPRILMLKDEHLRFLFLSGTPKFCLTSPRWFYWEAE
jgi:hypothetical protein